MAQIPPFANACSISNYTFAVARLCWIAQKQFLYSRIRRLRLQTRIARSSSSSMAEGTGRPGSQRANSWPGQAARPASQLDSRALKPGVPMARDWAAWRPQAPGGAPCSQEPPEAYSPGPGRPSKPQEAPRRGPRKPPRTAAKETAALGPAWKRLLLPGCLAVWLLDSCCVANLSGTWPVERPRSLCEVIMFKNLR